MRLFGFVVREFHFFVTNNLLLRQFRHRLAGYQFMDSLGGASSMVNGGNRDSQFDIITAGVNILGFGFHFLVGLNPVPSFFEKFGAAEVRLLANGGNQSGEGKVKSIAGNRDRFSSAGGVRLAQLHPLAFHSDRPVAVLGDFQRGRQEFYLHTLFDSAINFLFDSRHFIAGAAIEDG